MSQLKTAFLFPGQGSQVPGMGREFAESIASARAVFEEADRALGFPLSKLCFEGPAEKLQLTANTQPAILTVSVAAARVLEENGVRADFVAGHSLGGESPPLPAGPVPRARTGRRARKPRQTQREGLAEGVRAR